MGSRQFIVEVLDAQGVVVQRIPVDGVSLVASSVTGATPSTAATFSKVDGDNQTSAVSTAVTAAPSVKVVDASGLPVSGVSVSFIQLSSRSGVVAGAQQTTSGAGIATCTSWSLGTIVGTQRMEVKAGSLSTQTFTATAVAGSAFSISASGGTSQTTHAGAALPSRITVLVHDSWSNPVNGAVVTLTSTDDEGVFGSSTLTTVDTSGVTGTTYAVGSVAPSVASMLAAISSTSSARFDATSTVSAAANISIIQGDNQVGLISTALPTNPNVRITDTYGNQLTSSQVTWVIVAGGGSLSTSRTPTGSTGTAQTVWTLGGTPGLGQLEARGDFTSASTVTFDISISNPQADTIALIAGNSQSRGVGLDLTSRLTVATTGTGLPSQGVVTTWSVPNPAPGSDGTLGAATVNTGSDGSAGNTYSVGTTAGTKTITVSATGLTGSPILFTVSATTAANSSLTMIAQPSSNINDGQVFPQQPQVQIIDLYGNKCLSNAVTVTASKSAGGGTLGGALTASTDATGLATFAGLSGSGGGQSITLTFASSGLTSVTANAINIASPVGSQLAFTVQPGNITTGSVFSPIVVVAVQDSLGQTVPGATDLIALTVSVGGVLTGVVAVQAIAGLATFSGLGESATGTFTLTATSGTLTAATSASFTVSASNLPGGMTAIFNATGNYLAPQDGAIHTMTDGTGQMRRFTGYTAANCTQQAFLGNTWIKVTYPVGVVSTAPCNFDMWDALGSPWEQYKQLFFNFRFCPGGTRYGDGTYENNQTGTKLMFLSTSQAPSVSNNHIIIFLDNPTSVPSINAAWRMECHVQGAGVATYKKSQNVSQAPLCLGLADNQIEVFFQQNDIAGENGAVTDLANGVIKMWVNGTLVMNHTDMTFRTTAQSYMFAAYKINPTWGGGGPAKTRSDDNLYRDIRMWGVLR